jgi:hypothetical protein
MAKANSLYATQRNSKFRNSTSHFITLVDRLNDTINALPTAQAKANWTSSLKKAIQAFKKSYPLVKDFNNRKLLRLVQATDIPMMDIMVDTTMQREPDLQWIIKIITNFRDYQAQPMQVFGHGALWGAWDSQHTALAMYLIARDALNLDLATVMVPANIYDVSSRADLRNLFINMNTTTGKNAGKKPLDLIDIFEQMVYGVEVDGVTEQDWVDVHAKWTHLDAAGIFVTADKFNNTDEIGALSRLQEVLESSVEVVRQFAVYAGHIVDVQQRAINSKESPIIIEFLNLCEQQDIEYSDADIVDLADHCISLFGANFDARGPYWTQLHEANINAYNKMHKGMPKNLWPDAPRNAKNTPQGLAFFWHQLNVSWAKPKAATFKFPKQPFSAFVLDAKDLF